MKSSVFQTDDGIGLYRREWPLPSGERPRGTVLLVHGLGEHIGRYEHVAARLNSWAWFVVGYDQRGHGRSPGNRGRLHRSDDLLRDLGRVIDTVRSESPPPVVLLGHSMGGLVAARFVAEQALAEGRAAWARPVDALVLSSPALDPGLSLFKKVLLWVTGVAAPDLGVGNGLSAAWVSHDPAVVAAYQADPLVHDRVTPKLVNFIADGGEVARGRAPAWATPTLLMWAGSDRCVAPRGSAAFAAAAPRGVLTAHEFPSMFHELFNEPDQDKVFDVLHAWLDARFPFDARPRPET